MCKCERANKVGIKHTSGHILSDSAIAGCVVTVHSSIKDSEVNPAGGNYKIRNGRGTSFEEDCFSQVL